MSCTPQTIRQGCSLLLLVFFQITTYSQISYEEAFPDISFDFPVELQNAGDSSNRIFVVQQTGEIKVFPNSTDVTSNQVSTFLDISSDVSYSTGQEIGLLGLAFHPQFGSNKYIYVYYIDKPNNYRINIVRYQVDDTNPNAIDPTSKTIIAQYTKNQTQNNHNGGKIAFGPDGYLYISIGDGGGGGDPQGNGQNLNTVFGSILRIDIDVNGDNPIEENTELPNGNYEIPADNPRVGQTGLNELYAWGIRNTWKFSFDEAGRLWGADVGQNTFEEINIISNGGNYGWDRFEGNANYQSGNTLATNPDTKPIFSYNHSAGDKSITGGYVYNGSLSSNDLTDKYIYGDYLTGRVWALSYDQASSSASATLLFRASGQSISSFGEDEAGELYFLSYGNNAKVFKLTETQTAPTTIAVNGIGEWKGIANGTNGTVETIAQLSDNTRYVGGNFSDAGGNTVSNLALITPDEQWQTFSTGTNGSVFSIAIAPNGNVFVGGNFTQIGGTNANNIAFWDGTDWSSLALGTNGTISEIKFDQEGSLFVGGVFTQAGGIEVNNIAKWQNNSWSALMDSFTGETGANNEIRSLDFDTENNLYIGGNFDTAGGVSAARIARWDGLNWFALGEGTSGFVQAIEVIENYVYAGGNFNIAGNKTVNRIARWSLDTSEWERLGFGLSGTVNAIISDGDFVYLGGNFETASDTEELNKIVNNIARWSVATGWEALGTNLQVGVNSNVETLYVNDTTHELSVGGNFGSSGGQENNNIAIWGEAFCSEDSIIPQYLVNGVLEDGNSTLNLSDGDTLVLSMLPNDTIFTITLPDGQDVTGDYTAGELTTSMSGTYLFSTAQGCSESITLLVTTSSDNDVDKDGVFNDEDECDDTPVGETVDIKGCAGSQLDDDNDGVTNNLDQCIDTLQGTAVNTIGCEITGFPVNQFTFTTTTNSCAAEANGEINIVSTVTSTFLAALSRESETLASYDFSTSLAILELAAGTYDLCITDTSLPDLESCFSLVIEATDALSVRSNLNAAGTSVTLTLSGTETFLITLNEQAVETDLSEITLELDQDINELTVRSNNNCQETYSETIILKDTFIVYPNPITNFVTIDVSNLTDEQVEISLYTASGKLVSNATHSTASNTITLGTSSLTSGYFFLHLSGASINKVFKLIK
jgi:glucose/arabinose dehydrogenase